MALPAMEFQDQGHKIRKKKHKNQLTKRKLLNFENWTSLQISEFLELIILIFNEKAQIRC